MLSRKNKNIDAFSLLELIISIGILSIGIVVIMQALSFSTRVTGLSLDITKAVFLAQDKLDEFEFKESQHTLGQQPPRDSGQIDNKFNWQYNLSLSQDLNLYVLDFKLTWQRAGKDEELALNTYLSP